MGRPLDDALSGIRERLAGHTVEASPIDYGLKLSVAAPDGGALVATLHHSARKRRFTLTLPPGGDPALLAALAAAARASCDARVKGGPAGFDAAAGRGGAGGGADGDDGVTVGTTAAPVSGVPAIDERLTRAMPGLHAAGLFPEEMDPIPYGLKLTFRRGEVRATVSLYHSKKRGLTVVTGQGPGRPLAEQAATLLRDDGGAALPPDERSLSRWIGTDEAGKGDYFGPLVVAGVWLDQRLATWVGGMGVTDSKKLDDVRIADFDRRLRAELGNRVACVRIGPTRYNELYARFAQRGQKLNALLAWAHGRAVRDLVERGHPIDGVVVDRFTSERQIQRSMPDGLRILARPRAEDNPAVAAAAVVARASYMRQLEQLSERFGVRLRPGAGRPVLQAGRALVKRHGREVLAEVGKLHFRTTETIAGE